MDYLTRISIDHGQFYESLAIFKKALDIEEGDNYTNIDKLSNFFNKLVVPHFQYEESKLFPVMDESGSDEEKRLTNELRQDHLKMLKTIDDISNAILNRQVMAQYQGSSFVDMVKDTIKFLLGHARKEDASFYPNIKKYLLK